MSTGGCTAQYTPRSTSCMWTSLCSRALSSGTEMNVSVSSIKACRCRSQRSRLASLKLHLYDAEAFISRTYHKTAISANIAAARNFSQRAPLHPSPPRVLAVERLGDFTPLFHVWPVQRMLASRQWGLHTCSVFCVSGELSDLITRGDVLKQLRLVVLQLSHVMRISHQKLRVVWRNRWSGFGYCSLLASILTQVWTHTPANKRFLLTDH